jgi:integrase/recombinase XerD
VTTLAPTLQAYFTKRLILQRQASPHTIAAYRNTFKLLLAFAERHTGKPPSRLDVADLDAPLIGAFLEHLQAERANSTRTRNARLAAVHSLFRFAALHHPEHAAVIQRVLAIPPKRFDRTVVTYLTEDEIEALVATPDQETWTGRRDRAMLALACQTGLRASELTGLTVGDVHRPRQLRGEGPQTADHTADRRHRPFVASVARRTARRPCRLPLPDTPRHPLEPRRPGATRRQARGGRCPDLRHSSQQTGLASRHTPLSRHEAHQRRCGRRHGGFVVGPSEPGDHTDLHPR